MLLWCPIMVGVRYDVRATSRDELLSFFQVVELRRSDAWYQDRYWYICNEGSSYGYRNGARLTVRCAKNSQRGAGESGRKRRCRHGEGGNAARFARNIGKDGANQFMALIRLNVSTLSSSSNIISRCNGNGRRNAGNRRISARASSVGCRRYASRNCESDGNQGRYEAWILWRGMRCGRRRGGNFGRYFSCFVSKDRWRIVNVLQGACFCTQERYFFYVFRRNFTVLSGLYHVKAHYLRSGNDCAKVAVYFVNGSMDRASRFSINCVLRTWCFAVNDNTGSSILGFFLTLRATFVLRYVLRDLITAFTR